MVARDTIHRYADRGAALFASLCAVHCAAVPLIFALMPSMRLALFRFGTPEHQFAQWLLSSQRFDAALVLCAVVVAALSISLGWIRHRRLRPVIWATFGALLMLAGSFGPLASSSLGHALLVVCGGLMLTRAHLLNTARPRQQRSPMPLAAPSAQLGCCERLPA